jgi:hypothetical protein
MALIGDEIGVIAVHKFIAAAEAAEEIADGADGQPRASDAPDSKSTSSRATNRFWQG